MSLRFTRPSTFTVAICEISQNGSIESLHFYLKQTLEQKEHKGTMMSPFEAGTISMFSALIPIEL